MLTSSSEKTSNIWEKVFIQAIESFPAILTHSIFEKLEIEKSVIENTQREKNDFVRIGALRLLNIIISVIIYFFYLIFIFESNLITKK